MLKCQGSGGAGGQSQLFQLPQLSQQSQLSQLPLFGAGLPTIFNSNRIPVHPATNPLGTPTTTTTPTTRSPPRGRPDLVTVPQIVQVRAELGTRQLLSFATTTTFGNRASLTRKLGSPCEYRHNTITNNFVA